MSSEKSIVLHLGDFIKYNHDLYNQLNEQFTIIQPLATERTRIEFLKALGERKWGDFEGVFRPFWSSGGEMGRWDAELVSLLPDSLKIFASAGAGYDWADVDVLAERGILYCNGAQAPSEAVGDMALWHIISVFRNLAWSFYAARSLDPEKWLEAHRNVPETAHNPRGHVVGIIGLGHIGYTIAKKAYAALGVKIRYHDLYRKSEDQEKAVEATFCSTIEGLVGSSDCVVLATPFNGQKIITADLLKDFKKGSRFVNIARGALVDEDALADALESGQIFAAGLDVHFDEPHVDPRLGSMLNVSVTCHNGGGAIETRIGFEKLAMENVQRVLSGQEALTPVNGHLIKR